MSIMQEDQIRSEETKESAIFSSIDGKLEKGKYYLYSPFGMVEQTAKGQTYETMYRQYLYKKEKEEQARLEKVLQDTFQISFSELTYDYPPDTVTNDNCAHYTHTSSGTHYTYHYAKKQWTRSSES
jgi:hypothetical protein